MEIFAIRGGKIRRTQFPLIKYIIRKNAVFLVESTSLALSTYKFSQRLEAQTKISVLAT
jgi:hypothetical protein